MKSWQRCVLGLAVVLPLLAACDDDSTYSNAACVDTISNVRLDNSECSPNYGDPIGAHSWAYSSYRYDEPYQEIVYVGQPMPRNIYVYQRPAKVNVTRISAPQPLRVPGTTATSVREPSQSLLTDKRMVTKKQEEIKRNPDVIRGGFGLPSARVTAAPVPTRTLSSPAPGRAAPKPPKVTASPVKIGK